ncbi:MAG TPA: gamma-glutamyltransferase [Solirubrobacteraceae bacterium]|nr:gamma-glutamyltransferase [Solirubrobacteraceae bacterium]
MRGVVAAGHPLTAEAGAGAQRAGGNAVDAALAAMMAAFAAEPLLTGLGSGGYMLVGTPDGRDVVLDFFVEAPGRGEPPPQRADLQPVDVLFGDVIQCFNGGAAANGVYGTPSGICTAHARFARLPLPALAAAGIRLAREGVRVSAMQAYVLEILDGLVALTPEGAETFRIGGRPAREGELLALPELADGIERLAADGAAPFYTGDVAARVVEWVRERGGLLSGEDLAAYETIEREPLRVSYRGRTVVLNPPASAGGVLIASTLAELDAEPGPPALEALVAAMQRANARRTPEFLENLSLGNTTHVSVLDAEGWACSVTVSNGAASGVVVPGTGIHLNNMLGEEDLNPLGFFRHPPGRRLPSMMAPTLVRRDGDVELVVGSAGSNRIRSAILQVISGAVDRGLDAAGAVAAPRVHWEAGVLYAEPGIDVDALEAAGREVVRFRDLNLFFGGAQVVQRRPDGSLSGAGDPRRGGAAVSVEA